ncbi:family S54 unassigned peptidase (S54 family) [Schistosoma mansoni]|uniref:family S54 unassigned peptidase (S54 family) n=1 Tax=Schistosoma mansoni TaxID=6183 RepID=UPI00022DC5CB|nr:family S54 unassigned peptidase (S54 family) [Schistosoma mansoni]|eukprot:XP_018647973.1 family S54 unassigned peptidase (S54 family) [Schistosoma mansoni]
MIVYKYVFANLLSFDVLIKVNGYLFHSVLCMLMLTIGSLASSVTDSFSLVCGASGGCYALIGAHLATVIMNWDIMQEGWLKDPLSFISSGVVRSIIIIVLGGSDTALAIYDRFSNPNEKIRVGFSAHFGGFIAG